MAHSFSQTATLACPQCGHTFPAEIWLIVDGDERPDLLARAAQGDLHRLPCPQCGNNGTLDVPLLILRRHEPQGVLIFSPAENTTREEDQKHLNGLMQALKASLGAEWQEEWIVKSQVVPRGLLPLVLGNASPEVREELQKRLLEALPPAVREVMQLLQESGKEIQSEEDLQNLLARRPDLRQRLEKALRAAQEEAAPQTPPESSAGQTQLAENPPAVGGEKEEELNPAIGHLFEDAGMLGQTLIACLQARSAEEHRAFLLSHPELLSDAGLTLLERLVELDQRAGVSERLRFFLQVHRRAREVGVEAAFAEMQGGNAGLPEAIQTLLQQALQLEQTFLKTSNDTVLQQSVQLWDTLLSHPQFSGLPGRLQSALWNGAGGTYLRSYWRRGVRADLERAISLFSQALQGTPPDSPDRPSLLNNLANALSNRYAREGRAQDLEEAISTYRQALQGTPPDSPDRPSRLNNLANALRFRYAREGRAQDLEEGKNCLAEAYKKGLKYAPEQGLTAIARSLNWAFAREDWEDLIENFPKIHPALQRRLAWLGTWERESAFGQIQGVYARAGWAFLRKDKSQEAVTALEMGRAQGLREALEKQRQDIQNLPELLRVRYEAIQEKLAELLSLPNEKHPPTGLRRLMSSTGCSRKRWRRFVRLRDSDISWTQFPSMQSSARQRKPRWFIWQVQSGAALR
ncbi:CpXC domain-containing protein [Anaerolinea sp.]|uniref:CpXC domain-containing protein n=1 Tax=Anaerolinea sp. TaxID=1872519 RepID=UPI002ACE1A87|nr:CpXC domain-containing protein [Anaerolinea sp.]